MFHKIKAVATGMALTVTLLVHGASAQAKIIREPEGAGAPARLVETKVMTAAEQKAAMAFWTREAIAQAEPLAMPVTMDAPVPGEAAPAAAAAPGEFGSVPAGFADPGANRILQAAYPEDWAALPDLAEAEAALVPEGTSQIYTSYVVNQFSSAQKIYPHKWVGRLSFSTAGGTSYCSATAISNNVMVTAAHCLYDSTSNVWYSNWVFTPGYRNGNAPYGTFPALQCWVLTSWVNLAGGYSINGWAPHDVGVCKMGNNSAGVTLNAAVGWMGRSWNQPYVRHYHDLGYPFRDYNLNALPNAGQYLRTCVAESFQQAGEVRGMGCDLGPGISGGPWMTGYAINVVAGHVDGVNSGLFVGTRNIYGPRFNSNNIVPLCNAAVC